MVKNHSKSTKINQNPTKSIKIDQPKSTHINLNPLESTQIETNRLKSTTKIDNGPLKSTIFCFTARGWPVSPQALSIRPPQGGCVKMHRLRILSLLFNLHGLRAFRRARLLHGLCGPFGPQNRPKSVFNVFRCAFPTAFAT